MRVSIVLALCLMLGVQVILSQRRNPFHPYQQYQQVQQNQQNRQFEQNQQFQQNQQYRQFQQNQQHRQYEQNQQFHQYPPQPYALRVIDRSQYAAQLRQQPVSAGLGPIHFHGVIGRVPLFTMQTRADDFISYKALGLFPNLLPYLPASVTVPQLGLLDIDLPDVWLSGKLLLKNLVVKGVNQVSLNQLKLRIGNHRIDFNANTPHISADGNIGVKPVYLTGSVSIPVQSSNPSGAVGAKIVTLPSVGDVYQVDSADVTLDLQNIAINIDNGNSEDQANLDILKNKVLQDAKDLFASVILKAALNEVNKELAKIPASTIQTILTVDN